MFMGTVWLVLDDAYRYFFFYRDWWEKVNVDHIITPKESRLEKLMVCRMYVV